MTDRTRILALVAALGVAYFGATNPRGLCFASRWRPLHRMSVLRAFGGFSAPCVPDVHPCCWIHWPQAGHHGLILLSRPWTL